MGWFRLIPRAGPTYDSDEALDHWPVGH